MKMYDTSNMSVEQRLTMLESIVEQLMLDKTMSPTETAGCVGPETHAFPILTDGGGGAVYFKGNLDTGIAEWKKTDHPYFTSGNSSNVKVTVTEPQAVLPLQDSEVRIDVYYV